MRLVWRLFVPNAVVLAGAGAVLVVAPANGRPIVLAAGVAVMLALNLLITRTAVAPLERLIALTRRVDPLAPGERLEVGAHTRSEVSELAEAFNAMLERLEVERRDSARRTLSA